MDERVTGAMVLWNESARIGPLCARLRPYVGKIAIVVQESSDNTLELARSLADVVATDRHHGFGDASFGPVLLPLVQTPWTFKVDGDELPTEDLLATLTAAVNRCEERGLDGLWIPFRSWIEDHEWEAKHSHLRLFRTRIGWPPTLHSRPMTDNTEVWPTGFIEHRKSLDEHVRGYLDYLRVGQGNAGWDEHNRSMIWHACVGTAAMKGWPFVEAHEWWPQVRRTVFGGGVPSVPQP